MNTELKLTFPTIRMIDGKEVKKPLTSKDAIETISAWAMHIKSTKEHHYVPLWGEYFESTLLRTNTNDQHLMTMIDYKDFAKTKLSLGQFIAVDENGKPIEKPKMYDAWVKIKGDEWSKDYRNACEAYQQAQERVIFDGWELVDYRSNQCATIKRGDIVLRFYSDVVIELQYNLTVIVVETIDELTYEMNKYGLKLIMR